MQRTLAGLFWIALYLAVVVSPLALVTARHAPPARAFWIELSVAIGFVCFMQLGLQFVIVARFGTVTKPYGIDLILHYHREIGIVVAALAVLHPAILLARSPQLVPLLNPLGGTAASRWGVASLAAFILLLLTSFFRRQWRLSYEWWRALHTTLSLIALAGALVHILLIGIYANTPIKRGFLVIFSVAMAGVLGYLRIGRPLTMLRRPYRITDVKRERGRSWTLAVEPEAHPGMRFAPGQFAWMTIDSPFSFHEHPFSFSSSAERHERLEFGIKELGDFTSRIGELKPGTRVYLEGPHGSFSVDRHPAPGYVLIAGGIGITPMYSMIRTLADREDRRPLLLIYGTRTADHAPFLEQLQALTARATLQIVHAVDEPPEGWQGERGPIDAALLRRVLPNEKISRDVFVCGPDPMMTAVEEALLQHGIRARSIHMERFNLV